jgi:hypothetical protein
MLRDGEGERQTVGPADRVGASLTALGVQPTLF